MCVREWLWKIEKKQGILLKILTTSTLYFVFENCL